MADPYRPGYHISDPSAFINDPNGPVYSDGEYHVFYQRGWPKSWGHAVSTDLAHWQVLPPALEPDPLGDIWSGSVVVDRANTTGFFPDGPGLVAVFTHHTDARQAQSIAWSRDRGRTWVKHPGNPVLTSPTGERDFRDPKVFWHAPTHRWVMTLATGDHVSFYASPDLKTWEKTGTFGRDHGDHSGVWECPDLFELPVDGRPVERRWVLLVSYVSQSIWAPGSSGPRPIGVQYFVGAFDGYAFSTDAPPDRVLSLVHGPDEYATTTFSDLPDGRRIAVGWIGNWNYSDKVPTGPWKHLLSLPRELRLVDTPDGVRLRQAFVPELAHLPRESGVRMDAPVTITPAAPHVVPAVGEQYELVARLRPTAGVSAVELHLRVGGADRAVLAYDVKSRTLTVDRSRSGQVDFSPVFAARTCVPAPPDDGRLTVHAFVDRCSAEVLLNGGDRYVPFTFFPGPAAVGVEFHARGGGTVLIESLRVERIT